MNINPPVAPRATPASATPVPPVATPPAAPSAPASSPAPQPLADYDRLATESLRANHAEPAEPAPAAPAVAPESLAPTGPESPPVEPKPPGDEGTPASVPDDDAEAEVSPEILATLNDAGKRALQAEREKRKSARAELKAVKEQLAELQTKLNAPPATPPTPAKDAEAAPANPPAPTAPSADEGVLVDCDTFEAITARAMQATRAETAALRLNQVLLNEGIEAVLPQLAEYGLVVENEKLLDAQSKRVIGDATAKTVGNFITNVFEGARTTQAQAEPRRQFLLQRLANWESAAKILPTINDINSAEFKAISGLINARPELRARADGATIAVKLYLGELAWNAKLPKPAAATPPPKPPVTPALPAAPGAPRTSGAALPKVSERDELANKIKAGTATLAEVDRYSTLSLQPAT